MKTTTLFFRTFLAFFSAFLILMALVIVLYLLGYNRSVKVWNEESRTAVEDLAKAVLRDEARGLEIPEDVPLFVYDTSKSLVFSNRGSGKNRQQSDELIELKSDGTLLGYYFAGALHFGEDRASARFAGSMSFFFWLTIAGSLFTSLLTAFLFSRGLTRNARDLASGIDRMTQGNRRIEVQEKGSREIALIARSVNLLSRQLGKERDLRTQWSHDMTHDLRTPISALKAQIEGIQDGVLEPTENRFTKILKEIDRIEGMIADLEELIRLETPNIQPELEDITGEELLENMVERFDPEMKRKKLRFTTENAPIRFRGDRKLLVRGLSNIVGNAIRHTPEGGSIRMNLTSSGKQIRISITDTGQGISPEDLPKIFDRLFRGSFARETPGSGLGLTIAKRIMELHRGTIEVESRKGHGTEVNLSLPAYEDSHQMPAIIDQPAVSPPSTGREIPVMKEDSSEAR